MGTNISSLKKSVEKDVLGTIINGLNSGELNSQDAQDIAKEARATLKTLDEHEETVEIFYKNLSAKYDVFQLLYTKVRAEVIKSKELSAHSEALAAIESGNITGASKIAKDAIETSTNETASSE